MTPADPIGTLAGFHAEVEGFSGPFDLLCHLVETDQLEVASISVGEIVRIYGAYLANTRKVSVDVVFRFLTMAASLVLRKIHALLPAKHKATEEQEVPQEEDVLERLSRYRPYRSATEHLMALKEGQDRHFVPTDPLPEEERAWYLGDLYGLCLLWWNLLSAQTRSARRGDSREGGGWSELPKQLPDEELIENRISELTERLLSRPSVFLSELLATRRERSFFIVTVLALLEMSRLGTVRITQKELFHDLSIVLL